jgi:CDP-diacylglycerol---glycerol-3-phosphate 3-phosphatidyltransferase
VTPAGPPRQPPIVNVPNVLTAVRLVLVPVLIAFLVTSRMTDPGWRIAACLTFVFASVTDLADGWIARRWGLVTSLGKVADPIADKALTGSALILLSSYHRVAWWITVVILAREVIVTALRLAVLRYRVIAASRGGKLKTALQSLAIAWYVWPFPSGLARVGPWIMIGAVAVTVITGVDYLVTAVRTRNPVASGHASN